MSGRSIRVARIAGIDIGISPWWLLVVALFSYELGRTYFPEAAPGISSGLAYALGLASVLVLFASILLHELGHAIVARRHGVEVQEIDLWLLGGVAKMRGEARAPGDELRYALAGPAVTAVIAACFGALALLLPSSVPAAARAFVEYQFLIQAFILVFNLIPAFPLDGGRVLRAILWARLDSMQRATDIAARVGRAFGSLIAGLGVVALLEGDYGGIWFVLIGIFVVSAAGQQAGLSRRSISVQAQAASQLTGMNAVPIPGGLSLEQAANDYFGRYPHTAFPVVDADGRAVGLITIDALRAALRATGGASRDGEHVADVADRDPSLIVHDGAEVAALLERPAFARVGSAVVVDAAGHPIGIVASARGPRASESPTPVAGTGSA